jgi:hypothetical protein
MRLLEKIAVSSALLAASFGFTPAAHAQSTFHRITHVTFSGPVEIPGRILPAGEYVFQLNVLPSNETSIVEIRDQKGENVLATLLTIPDYRMTPTGKTVILFNERAGDSPAALRAWFYPGENYGHEFAYPMREATQIAAANHVNVPAIADNTSENDLNGTKVTEAKGEGNVAPTEAANTAPAPATPAPTEPKYQTSPAPNATNQSSQPSNNLVASNRPLPKTASSTYLVAAIGGIFLAVGLALGFFVEGRSQEERGL